MRREIAEGCHVPGRTDRGFKTPRWSAERRCRVHLSSGDPEDKPRLVDYAPFGASTSLSFKESEGPEPPTHVKQFAGGNDGGLKGSANDGVTYKPVIARLDRATQYSRVLAVSVALTTGHSGILGPRFRGDDKRVFALPRL